MLSSQALLQPPLPPPWLCQTCKWYNEACGWFACGAWLDGSFAQSDREIRLHGDGMHVETAMNQHVGFPTFWNNGIPSQTGGFLAQINNLFLAAGVPPNMESPNYTCVDKVLPSFQVKQIHAGVTQASATARLFCADCCAIHASNVCEYLIIVAWRSLHGVETVSDITVLECDMY